MKAVMQVRVTQRQIVQIGPLDLLFAQRGIARLRRAHVAVEYHEMRQAVLRRPKALQKALLLRGSRKRRAVNGAGKRPQLDALDRPAFENMYVFRPGKRRIRTPGAVKVVVSGRNKHLRTHAAQCVAQLLDRFAVGRLPVKQVSGKKHQISVLLVYII